MAEKIKRMGISLYPKDISFINNFDGDNFSDSIRELIKSYEFITGVLVKIGEKIKEKEFDFHQEDITVETDGDKYKVNASHMIAVAKFRKELEKIMGEEGAWAYIKMMTDAEIYKLD